MVFITWLISVSSQRTEQTLRGVYTDIVETTAQQAGASIKTEILGAGDKLEFIGEVDSIKSLDGDECNAKLQFIYENVESSIGNLGRIGPDGIFYCSINKQLIGVEGSSLGGYIDEIFADPEHRPVLSRIIKPAGSPSHLLAVHVPVYDTEKNTFLGTLGGAVSLELLAKNFVEPNKPSDNGFITLIDDNGDILYHPNDTFIGKSFNSTEVQDHFNNSSTLNESIEQAKQGDKVSVEYVAAGEERFTTFVPIEVIPGRYLIVSAVVPINDINSVNKELGLTTNLIAAAAFFGILFLAITVAITTYLNRKVFKPIESIARSASAISNGKFDQGVSISGGREVRDLGHAINKMLEKLRGYNTRLEEEVKQKTSQLSTALYKAETEHAKDEAILSSIGDGVFAVDNNGKIILFNKACEELTKTSAKVAVGKHYKDTLDFRFEKDNAENYLFIDQALSGKQAKMANHTILVRNDHTTLPVADSAAPIKDSHGKIMGAIVVFRDVTKEHELEKAKDEFVAISSHQLRTPATAVKQFLGIMREGYAGKFTEEQSELLNDAYESNERQLSIVNDMLDIASIDSGKLKIDKSKTNVNELLKSVIEEQAEVRKGRNQTLDLTMPDNDIEADIDPKLMRMVFENLVSNASKYTFEDKTLHITLEAHKKGFRLEVTDTGVGIAENDLAKLFGKFSRISNPLSAKVGGSGLGLYLTKQIILLHGGTIDVTSIVGKGTTFTVTLNQ